MFSEKWAGSALAGAFYRWSDDFTGLQFFRAGLGVSYIFDEKHALTYLHAIGIENRGDGIVTYANFPLIQLTIRINNNFKQLPARYINF